MMSNGLLSVYMWYLSFIGHLFSTVMSVEFPFFLLFGPLYFFFICHLIAGRDKLRSQLATKKFIFFCLQGVNDIFGDLIRLLKEMALKLGKINTITIHIWLLYIICFFIMVILYLLVFSWCSLSLTF